MLAGTGGIGTDTEKHAYITQSGCVSIVCWTDGGYGHVGYVTQVGQDGQIQILESNYQGQQQINNYRGWFDPQNSLTPGSVSYIYPGA